MDSGPVSTFQVHEYLRPKVNAVPKEHFTWDFNTIFVELIKLCFVISSYVTCMKMIPFSINLNAASVVMVNEWLLVLTGMFNFQFSFIIALVLTSSTLQNGK